MSKAHYITPEEFNHLVAEGKLIRLGYGILNTTDSEYAKRVIDALREINKKDPGFKYSCECDDEMTVWLFGHTIQSIHDEAFEKCKEIVRQNREQRNEPTDDNMVGPECDGLSACACPFDM